jgi:hypothetical protein
MKKIFFISLAVMIISCPLVLLAEDLIVDHNLELAAGTYNYGQVKVTNSAILILNGAVTINAEIFSIDSGAAISADGKGYPTAQGPGAGGTTNPSAYSCGGGAGYGGRGGMNIEGKGLPYGSVFAPVDLGSGGGPPGYEYGGNGGGAIQLNISDSLIIDGKISANGNDATHQYYAGFHGGGGSGGSVYIITKNLSGSGKIQSNGGVGLGITSGAGAGGRIALYYQNYSFSGIIEAKFGKENPTSEENGTIVKKELKIDSPITYFSLNKQSTAVTNLNEQIKVQTLQLNDGRVTGDFQGSFSLVDTKLVMINSGGFVNQGYITGNYNFILDGAPYQGKFNGAVYLSKDDNVLKVKAVLADKLDAVWQGDITKVSSGSEYTIVNAQCQIFRVDVVPVSAIVNIEGQWEYLTEPEIIDTSLEFYQANMSGQAWGWYCGPLTIMANCLSVSGANQYNGQGFCLFSYDGSLGAGQAWGYTVDGGSQKINISGMFDEGLTGKFTTVINKLLNNGICAGTIERMDTSQPPQAKLFARIITPQAASPGDTLSLVIELRNDGIKSAYNKSMIFLPTKESTYIFATQPFQDYEWYYPDGRGGKITAKVIRWDFAEITAKSRQQFIYKMTLNWGLAGPNFPNKIHIINWQDADKLFNPEQP